MPPTLYLRSKILLPVVQTLVIVLTWLGTQTRYILKSLSSLRLSKGRCVINGKIKVQPHGHFLCIVKSVSVAGVIRKVVYLPISDYEAALGNL